MTPDEDALLDRLRRVVDEADPVPDVVQESALAALSTRRLDDELAELIADSELGSAVLMRDGGGVRLLSFESASVSVELQLSPTGALRGLVAGAAGEVGVESPSGVRTTGIDAGGWFTVEGVGPGPFRLRLHATGGRLVVTAWVTS